METTEIILIRHGETAENLQGILQGHLDTVLNANGIAQAEAAARRLKREAPFQALYSSDLKRAAMTAEIIAGYLRLPVNLNPRLREWHLGEYEGWGDSGGISTAGGGGSESHRGRKCGQAGSHCHAWRCAAFDFPLRGRRNRIMQSVAAFKQHRLPPDRQARFRVWPDSPDFQIVKTDELEIFAGAQSRALQHVQHSE